MGKRRKKKWKRLDVDDVLTGKAQASIDELFRLIHQANPTHLDLPEQEAASRYSIKSRLQSILLQNYFDKVRISPDQDHDVISIDHRYGSGNACHALVTELDEDVRARVRRYLDEQSAPSTEQKKASSEPFEPPELAIDDEPPPEDLADLSGAELIKAGKDALEVWDYDRAKAAFLLALQRSGSIDAARNLLELFVDHLGLDREALTLESLLSRDALRDDDVRSLLAMAAARTGDLSRAEAYIEHLGNPRSAEVCIISSDYALAEGDEQAFNHWLELARDRDAPKLDIARLESALAGIRESGRAPLEQKLDRV